MFNFFKMGPTMTDDPNTNPFMDWMNMWSQASQAATQNPSIHESMRAWQETMRSAIEETVRGEAFLKQVGMNLEASQVFQDALNQAVEAQLSAMRLPTAKDVREIRTRLRQLDDRLEDMSDQFDDVIAHLKLLSDTTRALAESHTQLVATLSQSRQDDPAQASAKVAPPAAKPAPSKAASTKAATKATSTKTTSAKNGATKTTRTTRTRTTKTRAAAKAAPTETSPKKTTSRTRKTRKANDNKADSAKTDA